MRAKWKPVRARYTTAIAYLGSLGPELLEAVMGLASITAGVWLLLPAVDAFQRYPALFHVLSTMAPSWAWGLLALTLGVLKWAAAAAAFTPLARRRMRAILFARCLSADIGIFFWVFCGRSMAAGDPTAFSAWICLIVFSTGSLLLSLRLSLQLCRDAGRRDAAC